MNSATENNDTATGTKKYRINDLLYRVYGEDYASGREALRQYMDVSKSTLSIDLNIPADSTDEIPKARVIAYATFFECKPEDLINKVEKTAA